MMRESILRKLKKSSVLFISVLLFAGSIATAQPHGFNPDTVKAQKFDTGKMWTFEFPPFDYLKETYNFTPTQEWFDDVRLSALRIPGCTSSFVSEDGLIMTNNHCARGLRRRIEQEGEDLGKTGFYAATLEEERKVPNYSIEQLVLTKDVTDEVMAVYKSLINETEQTEKSLKKIVELEEKYSKETGLKCRVESYYNGGRYSLQGFKVYDDVRLVFQPEEGIAYFGGDPDNFTYPRYNLDCTFLRVYENDKPLKSKNFFKWSAEGAKPGELVFTVGNPGSTNRLRTVAHLEYLRDVRYRNAAFLRNNLYDRLALLKTLYPAKADKYEELRLRFSNSQKNVGATYKALNNPYLLARKRDFEKTMQNIVFNDKELNKEFGHVWETIENTRKELKEIDPKIEAYSFSSLYSSAYFYRAWGLVEYANQMKLLEAERSNYYKEDKLQSTLETIFTAEFDEILELAKLDINIDYIKLNLGDKHELVKKYFSGTDSKEIAKKLSADSKLNNTEFIQALLKKTSDEILKTDDPFVKYVVETREELTELEKRAQEVITTENIAVNMFGQIMFKIYGTTIPPDANRTLRLSDGVLAGFNYNGTIAPVKTTYYGLYDRYYSFGGEYPFDLPERWLTPPQELDLATPFNFVATADIVGGNSGSAVINKNAEVIGLAFDGNIESLVGNYIYIPEENRTVAVDSKGMMEAFDKVYKAKKLVEELKTGKLPR